MEATHLEGEGAINENPSSISADLNNNYIDVNIGSISLHALIDSGASFSVISEKLRRKLKKVMFTESEMVLKVADNKYVTPIGKCTVQAEINGMKQPIELIVLSSCSHNLILGWDFLEASAAIIDCGRAEILLKTATLKDDIQNLSLYAQEDYVLKPGIIKQISVVDDGILKQGDVSLECSKSLRLEKELAIPNSIVSLKDGMCKIWIVNSTTQTHRIPAGMRVAEFSPIHRDHLVTIDGGLESSEVELNEVNEIKRTNADIEHLLPLLDPNLSSNQREKLLDCLEHFIDCFDFHQEHPIVKSKIKHRIYTGDHPPIKQRPYRVSPTERRIIQTEVEKMIDMGVVKPSESPWSSPVVLVKKKDGTWRFCVDYRRLNKITKKDVYPLPRIDDALDALQGSTFFSTIDLQSGYWQVEVDEKDQEKTAFVTPDGLYEFKVLPFGLCNAPATFERMMDNLLRALKWTMCLCYMDDIFIFSATFEEHIERIWSVLQCIQNGGLRLNTSKCRFGSQQVKILGHLVDREGIHPDPEKLSAIQKFPKPQSVTDVRSFLGLSSYYRRFIKNFAEISRPLNDLLKKNVGFMWTTDQQRSFEILKRALTTEPVLGHFNKECPIEIHTDASGIGIGAVLVQRQGEEEKVIAYASRTLQKAERNYSTTERECLAIIWAIGKFRPYIFGQPFTIVTDHHSLCWLANLKDPSGRLARWALRLQEYDVSIVFKNGKKHKDADCLSRYPIPEDGEISVEIPSLMSLINIQEEQKRDPNIVKIIDKLNQPHGQTQKGFQIKEGSLYKKNFDPLGKTWLPVIPRQLRFSILRELHDVPTAGHLGFARTYDRIRKRFYWPGMYRDIRRYVAKCRDCQRRKCPSQRPPGLLMPLPPTYEPFQRVGIDLLGRFPVSTSGQRWIIVCTDYLTKFAITKALPTGEASEVAKFLIEDVILKHGAPRQIITDRGRCFQSKLVHELTKSWGVSQRMTSAYHPQTNGLTERLNKTLSNMLAMYVEVEQRDWDAILPMVTFAYNTAKQESTGFSPFLLVHGREAETTLDTLFPCEPNDFGDEYVQLIATQAEEVRQLARIHILKSQETDKRRYDEKHRPVCYSIDDLVWVFTPIRKVGLSEKLLKRYFGPYRVIRKLSDVTYEVEALDQNNKRRSCKDKVHVLRMKPYNDPDSQEMDFYSAPGEPTPQRSSDLPIPDSLDIQPHTKDHSPLGPLTRSKTRQLRKENEPE